MYLIFNAYHYFYYFIQYVVCNKAECWLRMVCNTDIDFTLTLKRHSYIPWRKWRFGKNTFIIFIAKYRFDRYAHV
jgi:hypothetical protein